MEIDNDLDSLAVQCLRVCPNRDTGFSPAELVLGHNIRTPLDLLYDGWVDDSCGGMELGEWVDSLRERLEMLWDSATDAHPTTHPLHLLCQERAGEMNRFSYNSCEWKVAVHCGVLSSCSQQNHSL